MFFVFILSLNILRYFNVGGITGTFSTFNGTYDYSKGFVGFSTFFTEVSTFTGLQHLFDTFNSWGDTVSELSNWLADGFPQNDLLAGVIYICSGVYYILSIIFAFFLDMLSMFHWFMGIIYGG